MCKTILFQGDSITDCGRNRSEFYSLGDGYPLLVASQLAVSYPQAYHFVNRGISGNRIVDVYARIKAEIINLKPDYLSLLIGINDVWHEINDKNGISAPKFETLYDLLLQEIIEQLPQIKIMIMEPFVLEGSATYDSQEPSRWEYFRAETALRAEIAKKMAAKYNLEFIPLQQLFDAATNEAPADYWLKDGVHPSIAGHKIIKDAWLAHFQNL